MAKRVELTERIKQALTKRGVTEFEKVAVFECTAASTRPINQKWSIFHNAKMTPDMLRAMSQYLETESVPLMQLHNNYALPTGQMLYGDTFEAGFDTELNVLFYVDADSDEATKIDLGIIDEVSVGAEAKRACCSKCGFDFFASDKTRSQLIWERTCDNDHTLGQDGTHLILDGVQKWGETSLVAKGASSRPKILPIDSQKLANDENYKRLAANGINPDLFTVRASTIQPTPPSTQEDDTMEAKELLAQLTQTTTELGAAQANVTNMRAELTQLRTKNTELTTQLAAAQTAPSTRETELTTQLSTVTQELNDVKSSKTVAVNFISEHYKKACALLSQDPKEDVSLEDMISVVTDARLALHQIPVNGVTDPATPPAEPQTVMLASSAFRTQK